MRDGSFPHPGTTPQAKWTVSSRTPLHGFYHCGRSRVSMPGRDFSFHHLRISDLARATPLRKPCPRWSLFERQSSCLKLFISKACSSLAAGPSGQATDERTWAFASFFGKIVQNCPFSSQDSVLWAQRGWWRTESRPSSANVGLPDTAMSDFRPVYFAKWKLHQIIFDMIFLGVRDSKGWNYNSFA